MTDGADRPSRAIRGSRVVRRPPTFAVTLLVLGMIFALAYVFVVREPEAVPVPSLDAVQGTYRWEGSELDGDGRPIESQTERGAFGAVAAGDAGGRAEWQADPSGDDSTGAVASAYDAATRTETTRAPKGTGDAEEWRRTIGAWPPLWRVATRSPLDYQGITAIVRSAVEDGDTTVGVKPIRDDDRTVWRVAMTFSGDVLVEATVDQTSGLVTWYSESGEAHSETFTAEPDWSAAPAAGAAYPLQASLPEPPGGAAVRTSRAGEYTYASSLAAAGRAGGFEPVEPTLLPDGFTLRAAATSDTLSAPAEWLGAEPRSAPAPVPEGGERRIACAYARGLTWFTLEQLGPAGGRAWDAYVQEMLSETTAERLSAQITTLQYGVFAGADAHTWYEKSGPTLLVSDRRGIVYATGALTRLELISLAEGLEPLE